MVSFFFHCESSITDVLHSSCHQSHRVTNSFVTVFPRVNKGISHTCEKAVNISATNSCLKVEILIQKQKMLYVEFLISFLLDGEKSLIQKVKSFSQCNVILGIAKYQLKQKKIPKKQHKLSYIRALKKTDRIRGKNSDIEFDWLRV